MSNEAPETKKKKTPSTVRQYLTRSLRSVLLLHVKPVTKPLQMRRLGFLDLHKVQKNVSACWRIS